MAAPQPLERAPRAEQLITGFFQGASGNCTSIAIIKAAMMAFGTQQVFADVRSVDSMDVVVMRDSSKEYPISSKELADVSSLSRFQGSDEALVSHANFMFAAMTKRVQMESLNEGNQISFEEAAEKLNSGQYWLRGPHWLGLDALVLRGPNRRLPASSKAKMYLENQLAGIGKDFAHTWFASMGKHDHRGKIGGAPFKTSGAISLDPDRIKYIK